MNPENLPPFWIWLCIITAQYRMFKRQRPRKFRRKRWFGDATPVRRGSPRRPTPSPAERPQSG